MWAFYILNIYFALILWALFCILDLVVYIDRTIYMHDRKGALRGSPMPLGRVKKSSSIASLCLMWCIWGRGIGEPLMIYKWKVFCSLCVELSCFGSKGIFVDFIGYYSLERASNCIFLYFRSSLSNRRTRPWHLFNDTLSTYQKQNAQICTCHVYIFWRTFVVMVMLGVGFVLLNIRLWTKIIHDYPCSIALYN